MTLIRLKPSNLNGHSPPNRLLGSANLPHPQKLNRKCLFCNESLITKLVNENAKNTVDKFPFIGIELLI